MGDEFATYEPTPAKTPKPSYAPANVFSKSGQRDAKHLSTSPFKLHTVDDLRPRAEALGQAMPRAARKLHTRTTE